MATVLSLSEGGAQRSSSLQLQACADTSDKLAASPQKQVNRQAIGKIRSGGGHGQVAKLLGCPVEGSHIMGHGT